MSFPPVDDQILSAKTAQLQRLLDNGRTRDLIGSYHLSQPLVMRSNSVLAAARGAVLKLFGTQLQNPQEVWRGNGIPSAAIVATGVAGKSVTGILIDRLTIEHTPAGAVFWKHVTNCDIGKIAINNIQTKSIEISNAGLEIYVGQAIRIGEVTVSGFRWKALELDYVSNSQVGKVFTEGGGRGQAAVHIVGGRYLTIQSIEHRGAQGSWGLKAWNTRDFELRSFSGQGGAGGIIVYGAQATFGEVRIIEPEHAGVVVDAAYARTTQENESSVDVTFGSIDIHRSAVFKDTQKMAIAIRTDFTGGDCPIQNINLGNVRVRGGWSGIQSVNVRGRCESVTINELDIGRLHSSGYPAIIKARNIIIRRAILRSGIASGLLFYTDEDTRAGELIIERLDVEPGLSSDEPAIRVGYPGGAYEGGFARVLLQNINADGGEEARTWLIDLNLDQIDVCESVGIEGVSGVRYRRAQQVRIAFNASSQLAPSLRMTDVRVTDSNGNPLTCAIENGQVLGKAAISRLRMPIRGQLGRAH